MNEENKKQIIFIYNANSGVVISIKDFFHKAFRKSTYQCNLCAVTFGAFGMKKEWKDFVSDLDVPVEFIKKDKFTFEFLHKDEFTEKYSLTDAKFPSAYLKKDSLLKLFISQDEMNSVETIDELKALVNKRLEDLA